MSAIVPPPCGKDWLMNTGKIIFSQAIDHLPIHTFRRCVQRYRGHYKVQGFSCLDQHLRIKTFFGTSENTVKTQIWIAVSVYVLIAIIKKRLNLEASLYTILQVLSVTTFEKTPLLQVVTESKYTPHNHPSSSQLNLFHY